MSYHYLATQKKILISKRIEYKIIKELSGEKMADFTVSEVVDGDTFKVKNGWEWKEKGKKGDTVRPTGYNTPEEGKPGYEEAEQKLKNLILGKVVDIKIQGPWTSGED